MRNCSCKVLNDIYCNAVSALKDTQVEYKSACDACNEFDAARDFAFCLPNKELDAVDRLVYDEQLNAFRNQLSSEDATKLDRLLAGECFRGRKKMIRELKVWMVDFDPYNEDD